MVRVLGFFGMGALVSAMLVWNFLSPARYGGEKALLADSETAKSTLRSVNTVAVRRSADTSDVVLPGTMQAIQETPIYARSDGYLRLRPVDLGDRVKKGQLLAELESPELDQSLLQGQAALEQAKASRLQAIAARSQAIANLAQAQANLELALLTLNRNKEMIVKGVVAKQDVDIRQHDYDAGKAAVEAGKASVEAAQANISTADANIRANEANVQRLMELVVYRKVLAPFDGIITARNAEVGTLIAAGSGTGNREIFRLGRSETLRVFVNVPQSYATSIHPGQEAEVSVQERPGQVFPGKVARESYALDPVAHTMVSVVHIENSKFELLPGMYAQVKFKFQVTHPPLLIPADGLMVQTDGVKVATVGKDHKIHIVKLTLGRDYGSEIEVLSGLPDDVEIVVNPPEDLREGENVSVSLLKRN